MTIKDIPREKFLGISRLMKRYALGTRNALVFVKTSCSDGMGENQRPIVENPYNCVLGCSACANLCSLRAIRFPSLEEIRALIRKIREEAGAVE